MQEEKQPQIAFDDFTLNSADESLWKGSQRIHLRPKTFALLEYLTAHPGQLVTKDQLLSVLWPGCNVGDEALKHCVAEIRKALKDHAEESHLIQTAHRRGYRFIGEVIQQRNANPLNWNNVARRYRDSELSGCQLVGRMAELNQLSHNLEKALSGVRQVVFVTGEQGIGKTTLVDAFLELAKGQQKNQDQESLKELFVTRGQCIKSHGAGEAYMPFYEAITSLCSKFNRGHVVALLRRHAPLWLLQMPGLISAAQLRNLRHITVCATRERMLREMTQALEALTEEAPLILVLEDLHWSDYSTLDLICYLAQRRQPARLLLIATYRPAEIMSQHDHPLRTVKQELQVRQQCQELPVSFLNEAAVGEYLIQRFPGHEFPANTAAWLQQRTAGNPLFLVNVLDHMIARGLIVQHDTRWALNTTLQDADLALPPTIQQIIERQIEMCTPQERRLLQAGSVEGMEFSVNELAAVLGENADRVEIRCRKLAERNQFLQQLDGGQSTGGSPRSYRFIHTLYQNTCYQMLPEELQARLHRRSAEFMERANGSKPGELASRLAMHFDRAGEYRRAIKYYQQASTIANARYAGPEALGLARQGIRLLDMIPDAPERKEREMCLQIQFGTALASTQGLGAHEAYVAFSRARELFQELSRDRRSRRKALLFSALSGLWSYHWARAECEMARQLAEQMLQLAETERDASLLDRAHASLGLAMMDIGEFTAALKHFQQSKRSCHAELVRWHLGYADQALKNLEKIVSNASEDRRSEEYIFAHTAMAWLHFARRECELALDRAKFVMDLALQHGLVQGWIAPMKGICGWALCKLGQTDQGFEQIRQALTGLQSFGATNLSPLLLMMFADASLDARRIDEGLAAVEEALNLSHRNGIHSCDAELYRLKGELLWQQVTRLKATQYAEVESCLEEAIRIARRQKAKSFELRATTSMAKLLQKRNRKSEAHERLRRICQSITEGHDIPDIRKARELLQELSQAARPARRRFQPSAEPTNCSEPRP
jgi:predicted ATPase/DNA-binding winged helix-turn-helix (wHTH) protein